MWFGAVLIIIGAVFLLNNMGLIEGDVWSVIWPILVILLGASIIVRRPTRIYSKKEDKK